MKEWVGNISPIDKEKIGAYHNTHRGIRIKLINHIFNQNVGGRQHVCTIDFYR